MTIHTSDPFATPEEQRSKVRRLRGRLPSPVTIWTAYSSYGPAGLTVSSVLVVDGDPGRVVGLVDDESDFWDAAEQSRRFAVVQLTADERMLADQFAGIMPAPGGRFRSMEWIETRYGPVPAGDRTWAGCVLDASRPYGWGLLIEGTIETIEFSSGESASLVHVRGRYSNLDLG